MGFGRLCSYRGLDLSYQSLVELLANIGEKQGWDQPISVVELYSHISDDKKLSKLLGESLLMFKANIHCYSSRGDYQLVVDKDEALVAVLINLKQFNKTIEENLFQLTICGCNPQNT